MRSLVFLFLLLFLGFLGSGCQQFFQDYNYSPAGTMQLGSNP